MPRTRDTRNLKVEEWFSEIDDGLSYRRKHGLEDSWSELEALYYNVHESLASDSPNIIAATGDSFLSELTVPNPYILVRPSRPESVDGAPIIESVVNNLLYELKVQEHVEEATLHAYLWSRGFLKIGFDSEFGWDPSLDIGGKERAFGLSLSQFDKRGRRIEFAETRPGMPWISSVLPHDIVVPWGVRFLDSSPWVVHRVVRHVDDVKADAKYEKTRDLQPVMSMEDYTKSYQTVLKPYRVGWIPQGISSRKAEFAELWEAHNRRDGRIIVLATGHKKFLRNDIDHLLTEEGYPFATVGFVPRSRTFWTTPDAYYLKYHQAEQTDISLQATKQRRISMIKFLYDKDVISEEELEKLLSADVGAGAAIESGHKLQDAIMMIQPGNNSLLYQDAEFSRRSAREVIGFSRNKTGEFESGRHTATEVLKVDQGGSARMSRRVVRLKRLYEDTSRKLVRIVSTLWRAPRMAQVVGVDGEARWMRFTGADLKGKYKYSADFVSEAGESLQARRQRALQLYVLLLQDPLADPVAVRRYLSVAFNDPEIGRLFRTGEDAELRLQMSRMQGEGGGVSQGRGTQSPRSLPVLQG